MHSTGINFLQCFSRKAKLKIKIRNKSKYEMPSYSTNVSAGMGLMTNSENDLREFGKENYQRCRKF